MDDPPPPYDAPPSYEDVIRGFCHVPTQSGLSVVDFLPEMDTIRFPTLVERANIWLHSHPMWEAKTCESVEFKSKGGIPKVESMTFLEHNTGTAYVRGLRLWLIPRKGPLNSPQQISYFNAVPKITSYNFFSANFERLDSLLSDLNHNLSVHPIDGRILTVEMQPMKFSTSQQAVDPDRSYFHDFGFSIFVLRIFYEIGTPCYENIGITDFFPRCQKPAGILSRPLYAPVPATVADASEWCSMRQNIRICNIQTISMKLKPGLTNGVDNMKMSMRENRSKDHWTEYIRVLRLAYVKSMISSPPIPALNAPLTCKTFLPVQLTTCSLQLPEFETTQQTLTRIAEWSREYNVKIISAETVAVRMYTGNEGREGPETSYLYNKAGIKERFIFVVRLYLEGEYPDPPIIMRPISHRGWASHPVRSPNNIPSPTEECCVQ